MLESGTYSVSGKVVACTHRVHVRTLRSKITSLLEKHVGIVYITDEHLRLAPLAQDCRTLLIVRVQPETLKPIAEFEQFRFLKRHLLAEFLEPLAARHFEIAHCVKLVARKRQGNRKSYVPDPPVRHLRVLGNECHFGQFSQRLLDPIDLKCGRYRDLLDRWRFLKYGHNCKDSFGIT